MEHEEKEPMTDGDLSALLQKWKVAPAPPSLETRVFSFRTRRHWPVWVAGLAAALAAVVFVALGVRPAHITRPAEPPAVAAEPVSPPSAPVVNPRPEAPQAAQRRAQPPRREKDEGQVERFLEETRRAGTTAADQRPPAEPAQGGDASLPTLALTPSDAAARLIEQPRPVYPPEAKAARIQGVVALQIRIGTDGRVIDVSVISGHPLLVDAAVEAVRQWVYRPTLLNGDPVEVITQVNVNFTLTA